jgi:hypothetical protein
MSEHRLLLARYACSVCGWEWETTKERLVDADFPDGIDCYGWTKCPDHPDARGHLLCTFCGDWSRRCGAKGCQRPADELSAHVFLPDYRSDGWCLVALCRDHLPSPPFVSKHFSEPVPQPEAQAWIDSWNVAAGAAGAA